MFPDTTKVRRVVKAMNDLRGTKLAGKQWNDRLTCVLETLGVKQCASDYGVYMRNYEGHFLSSAFLQMIFWSQLVIPKHVK